MPFEPLARARLAAVHLAVGPSARERRGLRVDVLRLQMVQQIGARLTVLVAVVPVAASGRSAVGAPRPVGREANGFRLRQNRAFGALGQRRRRRNVCVDGGRLVDIGGGDCDRRHLRFTIAQWWKKQRVSRQMHTTNGRQQGRSAQTAWPYTVRTLEMLLCELFG